MARLHRDQFGLAVSNHISDFDFDDREIDPDEAAFGRLLDELDSEVITSESPEASDFQAKLDRIDPDVGTDID